MDKVGTQPYRFQELSTSIFALLNFIVWLIWPNVVSVVIFAVLAFVQLLIVLLKNRKYDGEIAVSKYDVKTIFGLNLSIPPEKLAMKDEVTFQVVRKNEDESQA